MSLLTDPHVAIIFAYAPAGLGHLRVSRALRLGLPPKTHSVLLPDPASSVRTLHRFTSTNSLARQVMEWGQYGIAESVFTKLYRTLLTHDAWRLEEKILDVLKQRVELPQTVLLIATHFGIAHQVSAIKTSLKKRGKVRVLLVVQVTDDSPQKLWYVPNADAIFVPSEETRKSLLGYKRTEHLAASRIVVSPYPISPLLTKRLSGNEQDAKEAQADPSATRRIHICVPLSGAQVGMTYTSSLMRTLHHMNDRFHFHIIGKRTMFSKLYLLSWNGKSYATIYESHSDRQIVELYEEAYQESVFLAEITKPSEQAFKAILSPKKRGGVILLFTQPIGRQEYDNLNFLRRHKLMPTAEESKKLYDASTTHTKLPTEYISRLSSWRALTLPIDPMAAAAFIFWLHKTNCLEYMLQYTSKHSSIEIADTGVQQFWDTVSELV
jgi:hypothetical protein